MTDWQVLCRAAAEDVRLALAELPRRADREPIVGRGRGGDDTTAIDAADERAVISRFEGAGVDGALVSEEAGEVDLGLGGPTRIVVDPIDGSLNAKRGIGFFSLSIAVANGLLTEGRRSLVALLDRTRAEQIPEDRWREVARANAFADLDTPADVSRWSRRVDG